MIIPPNLRTIDRTPRGSLIKPTIVITHPPAPMPTEDQLRYICEHIYRTLGRGHTEAVYHHTLIRELREHGAAVVWSEYKLPLVYQTIKGGQVTASNQYADILAEYGTGESLLVETKASGMHLREDYEIAQVERYAAALTARHQPPTAYLLVNFSTRKDATGIAWKYERLF